MTSYDSNATLLKVLGRFSSTAGFGGAHDVLPRELIASLATWVASGAPNPDKIRSRLEEFQTWKGRVQKVITLQELVCKVTSLGLSAATDQILKENEISDILKLSTASSEENEIAGLDSNWGKIAVATLRGGKILNSVVVPVATVATNAILMFEVEVLKQGSGECAQELENTFFVKASQEFHDAINNAWRIAAIHAQSFDFRSARWKLVKVWPETAMNCLNPFNISGKSFGAAACRAFFHALTEMSCDPRVLVIGEIGNSSEIIPTEGVKGKTEAACGALLDEKIIIDRIAVVGEKNKKEAKNSLAACIKRDTSGRLGRNLIDVLNIKDVIV